MVLLRAATQCTGLNGTFTKTTGTVGDAGTAQLAGSLLLANNNFYREFTDDPVIGSAAQALPQMQGSGKVRDLRPAMSLGTAQALDLQAKLTQFAADTTKAQQMADLDAVIQSWGNTSAMPTSAQTNRMIANYGGPNVIDVYGATAIEKFSLDNPAMYAKITALEQFNGQTILDKWVRNTTDWYFNEQDQGWRQYTYGTVSYSAPQEAFINQAYEALKGSVYGALVTQTRLKPYLDSKPKVCYKVDSFLRNVCKGWRHKRHVKKVTTSTNNAISTADWRGFAVIASQLDAAQSTK